jgi:heterodisulfide reductase subunit C
MEAGSDVIWRTTPDLGFLDEVMAIPGGEDVITCIQCGNCSGSCPTSRDMDYSPRQIFALTRAGYRDVVLGSKAIWLCCSCYSCTARCPKEIKITDILYKMKQLAMKYGYKNPETKKARTLAKEFTDTVRKYGRNHEMTLLRNYMLKTDPFGAVGQVPLGMRLFSKGRLSLFPKKNKGVKEVRKILDHIEKGRG